MDFKKLTFDDKSALGRTFLKSFRSFPNVQFNEVEVNECGEFFKRFGADIETLSIVSCDISERKLQSILQSTKSLRQLQIQQCSDLFISGRFLTESNLLLENVTCLSLALNRHLTDLLFNRITQAMPNLSSLDLSGNTISFHKGLHKKFYPGSHDEECGSKTVFTSFFIQKFLRERASKIKELTFNSTLIDGNALQSLAENCSEMQLESLFLKSCDQLTNDGIISFIDVQRNLQVLDLSLSVRLTDLALMHICECLKNLKVLKVRRCRALTDISVKLVVDLPQLEVLDISECEAITSAALIDGIASKRNELMKELYLSALNISEAAIVKVSENFPNLRVLDLSYCIHIIDDVCLQAILKNLTLLRELNLSLCERISDEGLTGMGMVEKIEDLNAIKEKENEKAHPNIIFAADPSSQPIRISLQSKAEREIVEDAMRKRAMLRLAKEINLQDQKSSNYSIARLRGLRVLKLSGCNKVSDVSLIYNFKLPELKEINLSKCQQISMQGIKELVENCPALEVVNLSECHNINDKCIELITRKLPRLTTLDITRCHQLTDFSLDYIAVHCKRIRKLNLGGCRHMSDEPNLKLVSVESLRNISNIKGGSEIENPARIPRPPTFSSLFSSRI